MDEDGNIVNNGGNIPPGLNRRDKTDKEENPNPPETPENPGTEDSDDAQVNSAGKGTHIYTYDELNRMATSNIAKVASTYTYDTLGNLVYEVEKNVKTDYQYNELNQLVSRKQGNESYTYSYDKRGNRIAEAGKKETREYIYDETNHLVEGTNWKGDKSAYTYNGVDVRINNTQTSHSGSVYSRDYVIDYTSLERDDLMVFAEGDGQLDYVQREVYAGSERIEQFTDRSNGGYERLLYVHEDLMGNTRYYTKANGQSYAELTYDAWGMPESPNKLLNNDHGNYVYATYTGHIFDTTLDIYFAEARFYDANTRTWLAMDPIKDGGNWYQYCYSNPLKYWDPMGLAPTSAFVRVECGDTSAISKAVINSMIAVGLGATLYTTFPALVGVGSIIGEVITGSALALGTLITSIPPAAIVTGIIILVCVGGIVVAESGILGDVFYRAQELKDNLISFISPDKLKWGNPKSTPTYGHTFSEHGEKKTAEQLTDRARSLGNQVGQWSNNQDAADFLADIAKNGEGVYDVDLPSNVEGRSYLPDGTEVTADKAKVVVKSDGSIRTAYPYSSAYSN